MVDPVNILLSSSLINTQNMAAMSHTDCADVVVGGPKLLGNAGGRPLEWRVYG